MQDIDTINIYPEKYDDIQHYHRDQNLSDKDVLINLYERNCSFLYPENMLEPPSSRSNLRLMTWNVRYFTNARNEQTFNEIIKDIIFCNPDILCLNEVTLGHNDYYNQAIEISDHLKDYHTVAVCAVGPTWFSDFYGNMILIKKEYIGMLKNYPPSYTFNMCDPGSSKCYMNQRTYIYQNPAPESKYYSGTNWRTLVNQKLVAL